MRRLWGGVFGEAASDVASRFGQSIESDLRFWKEDVQGSIAHARMLGQVGILTGAESEKLIAGLEQILAEGPEKLPSDVEDIHTAIEVRLGEIIGEVAEKLHTARSRNDQVATDTRLYLRRRLDELLPLIKALQGTLLELAKSHKKTVMPGYTHQQPAMPITLGFWALAHFWALQRHGWRAERLRELLNFCPLGSAALAGTNFPIDRNATAKELGFSAPTPNALDATSDRSYVLDALHLCALILIDLSRVSQELILWSMAEFGFVRLGDAVTTGSSIMPQKRNPDMAELIRGRTGRALSNWVQLATTLKALPLGYNRDTQDDKPPLFESLDLVQDALQLAEEMLRSASWNKKRMAQAAKLGFANATEIANALVEGGLTFRQAHERVGIACRQVFEQGAWSKAILEELMDKVPPTRHPKILQAVYQAPRLSASLLESFGGAGQKAVAAQCRRAVRLHNLNGFRRLV